MSFLSRISSSGSKKGYAGVEEGGSSLIGGCGGGGGGSGGDGGTSTFKVKPIDDALASKSGYVILSVSPGGFSVDRELGPGADSWPMLQVPMVGRCRLTQGSRTTRARTTTRHRQSRALRPAHRAPLTADRSTHPRFRRGHP